MRLKGGKLLLDLSDVDISTDDVTYNLSEEEYNCLLSKGAEIKVKVFGILIILPLIFYSSGDGTEIAFNNLRVGDDALLVYISVEDKTFNIKHP